MSTPNMGSADNQPRPKANALDRIVSWLFPKLRCRADGIPHDYKVRNGGDGTPCHFVEYTCWKCGERFSI